VHLGYEVVSVIVYSYECTFARSSVIFHRKGSDDDRTTPAEDGLALFPPFPLLKMGVLFIAGLTGLCNLRCWQIWVLLRGQVPRSSTARLERACCVLFFMIASFRMQASQENTQVNYIKHKALACQRCQVLNPGGWG